MARFKTFSKVLPAANLPMMPDLSIDEQAYRKHLRWLMTHDIGGLVIRLMRRLGLVWKVNVPTREMQQRRREALS